MRKIATILIAAACVGCASGARSTPATTSSVDDNYKPQVGMAGKDVVWVPTSEPLVEKMLDLANVTAGDFVIDLGSGDGRNIIAAARRGARGLGVEFNPDLVALSRRLAAQAGVSDRASFAEGDMYEADISKATVMTLFLLPGNLERLRDKFLALAPGARIVQNTYPIPGWDADVEIPLEGNCQSWCTALLYIVPANVAGVWQMDDGTRLTLVQAFQQISGAVGPTIQLTGKLTGAEIAFRAGSVAYTGNVNGDRMTGTRAEAGSSPRSWSATRVR